MSQNEVPFFSDLPRVLSESLLMSHSHTLMGGMPELLNRMQIGSQLSLKEMQDIFNEIMN